MPNEYERKNQEHCLITNPLEYAGKAFLLLGFLVSGVFLLICGSELHKTSPDLDSVEVLYALGAAFFILAAIGYYMITPNVLCSSSERGLEYFGTMFILIGFIGVSGFMLGSAINFNSLPGPAMNAPTVRDFSYLAGVFLILFAIGWIICNCATNMNCNGDTIMVHTVGHYLVVIFLIVAGGVYFAVGNLFGEGEIEDGATCLIVVGVCYIFISIGLILSYCL